MAAQNKEQYVSIAKKLKALERKLAYLGTLKGIVYVLGLALLCFGMLIGITLLGWPDKTIRFTIDLLIVAALFVSIYFVRDKAFNPKAGPSLCCPQA